MPRRPRPSHSTTPTITLFAPESHTQHGILGHCRYPPHTSLLEGMNNKIKVLTRMAYGYRDDGYFFLKIMDAFSAIPENAG